jgi:hypothetical protein
LAAALKKAISPEAARITRPHKTGDLRFSGLDDATTSQEMAEAVAKAGACTPAEVRVGQIRPAPSGVHSAWVQCPLASANKIAGVGRLKVGWVVARATLLTQRPLQCFRCLERGHVRERCTRWTAADVVTAVENLATLQGRAPPKMGLAPRARQRGYPRGTK